MEIKHQETESKGAFYIEQEGEKLAEMTYSKAGTNRIIIDHTEVSDKLKGQGAGKAMVMKAVDYAREKNLQVLPLCPFAKAVFDKNKEIQDLL